MSADAKTPAARQQAMLAALRQALLAVLIEHDARPSEAIDVLRGLVAEMER